MKKPNYPYYDVRKFNSINEMLDIAANEAGDVIAFKYKEDGKVVEQSYADFFRQITHLGAALVQKGYSNAHIGCIGANSHKWVVSYLTVLRSSGVFVPIDKELPQNDIFHIINESETRVIFYTKADRKSVV